MPGRRPTPVLLVDVDGVISLWGFPVDARPAGTWANVDGTLHWLSAEAARVLRGLEDLYELVWCTGWEERANEHLPHLLGLGPFPHLSFDRDVGGRTGARPHWKLDAIDAAFGPDRPVAWVDDAFNEACHEWQEARPGPTLLVATEPATGLQDAHARELRAWAADLRG